jgi:hypothetical protein
MKIKIERLTARLFRSGNQKMKRAAIFSGTLFGWTPLVADIGLKNAAQRSHKWSGRSSGADKRRGNADFEALAH